MTMSLMHEDVAVKEELTESGIPNSVIIQNDNPEDSEEDIGDAMNFDQINCKLEDFIKCEVILEEGDSNDDEEQQPWSINGWAKENNLHPQGNIKDQNDDDDSDVFVQVGLCKNDQIEANDVEESFPVVCSTSVPTTSRGIVWMPSITQFMGETLDSYDDNDQVIQQEEQTTEESSDPQNDPKKPHMCHICSYRSANRYTINQHITAVHEGLKPFGCQLCCFKTSMKTSLSNHVRTVHEGLKPFSCHLCSYKASRNSQLIHHVNAVHEGLKPYSCKLCRYKASRKNHITNHMKVVHERIKPHSCSLCLYKASVRSDITRHMKVVHKKIVVETKK